MKNAVENEGQTHGQAGGHPEFSQKQVIRESVNAFQDETSPGTPISRAFSCTSFWTIFESSENNRLVLVVVTKTYDLIL
jgi:hypothetical protein